MLRVVGFLFLVPCLLAAAQAQSTGESLSLAGTVWEGTVKAPDSAGKLRDYPYLFQLQAGNKLHWRWEGSNFTNGKWQQTGRSVRLDLNDGYSTWLGTLDGNQMSGSASNRLGYKWNWILTRRAESVPVENIEKSTAWRQYESTHGRFSVLLPGEPEVKEQLVETPVGKLTNHVLVARTGDAAIVVAYADYPASEEDPQIVLDRVRDGTIKGINATLISSNPISNKGFPGREYHASTTNLKYSSRIFLVNRRLYQMAIVGAPDTWQPGLVSKFLDSFTLVGETVVTPRP